MRTRRRFLSSLGPVVAAGNGVSFAADSTLRLARPTREQAAWHDLEFEMFIHFGPATWENVQHSDLSAPLSSINPEKLDTDQWVDVAVSMGARLIIFVAKHDGGFCWWQTQTTDYSVRNTPWRGGKGDVLQDLAASCRKRGVRLGVYLSPADRKLGVGIGGRAKTPEAQEQYNKIFRQQLTELLSRYGDMTEVWFDGSLIVPVGDILQRHAAKAMVFQGPHATIRWAGNEEGTVPYPAWNSVPLEKAKSGVATGFDSDPDGEAWLPLECDGRIRADWFWNRTNVNTLKSVDKLMDMYYRSVGHGAVLLLNHTPDTSGMIPESDVRRAAELGAEIRRRFSKSVVETSGKGSAVELNLRRPTWIDHVMTMEDILQGERVREYVIECFVDGKWKQLCEGTAIGHKKIDRFAPVQASRVRARFTKSAAAPQIRKLAVFSVYREKAPRESQSEILTSTRTLWKWSPQNLTNSWTTVSIDLTPFCKDAGVYRADFVGGGVEFQSVGLSSRGVRVDQFAKLRKRNKGSFVELTIAEESSAYTLQMVVRTLAAGGSRGYATIYRRLE